MARWTFSNRKAVNFSSIEVFPVQNILAYGADANASGSSRWLKCYGSVTSSVISTFNAFPMTHVSWRRARGDGLLRFQRTAGDRRRAGRWTRADRQGLRSILERFCTPSILVTQRTINGGFNIAVGNVENLHAGSSEIDDIVTVPSRGVSDVRVFDKISTAPALYREFTAWGTRFLGGSSVAVADLNLDARGDVIVGSGPGMVPTIDAFDVTSNAKSYVPFKVFTPFASSFLGGVNVSAVSAGGGVASPLVVASQGISTTPTVQIFNGLTGAKVNTSTPFSGSGSSAPVRTIEKLVNGHLFVFAAQQANGKPTVIRQFDPSNPSAGYVDYILETDPNFLFGVFLG